MLLSRVDHAQYIMYPQYTCIHLDKSLYSLLIYPEYEVMNYALQYGRILRTSQRLRS